MYVVKWVIPAFCILSAIVSALNVCEVVTFGIMNDIYGGICSNLLGILPFVQGCFGVWI